jgi:hypothetical protein
MLSPCGNAAAGHAVKVCRSPIKVWSGKIKVCRTLSHSELYGALRG